MLEGFSGGIIVAFVDFLMVFVVLGGLALTIGVLKRFVEYWIQQTKPGAPAAPVSSGAPTPAQPTVSTKPEEMKSHLAAVMAALCQFTSLKPGSFKIDSIKPLEPGAAPVQPALALDGAHVAAISVAIHEFTSMPMGSLQITGIKPLGPAEKVNTWKVAGKLDLMGPTGK